MLLEYLPLERPFFILQHFLKVIAIRGLIKIWKTKVLLVPLEGF